MAVLTRQELYDLVWAEPVRTVAASLGLSDVGLKKHCLSAGVPVPERGYWARLKAGKPVVRVRLPPRAPGKAGTVHIGGRSEAYRYDPEAELREPPPQPPVFEEPLDQLRERIVKQVGKVVRSRDLLSPSAPVRKLLEADARRAEKFKTSPWDWNLPYFQSPFEQRRLRIIDALAKALPRHGGKLEVTGGEGRSLRFKVGDQAVDFTLDHPKARPGQWGRDAVQTGPVGPLRLELKPRWKEGLPRLDWTDGDGSKLEDQLSEIVVSVLLTGEAEYRNLMRAQYSWALERRAQNEAEVIKRRAEAEQRERERLEREARERRDLLFSQAQAWRTATDIRGYVGAVIEQAGPNEAEPLIAWRDWALSEADLLDPVKQGALVAPDES